MKAIQIVAFDLDGTLLDSDKNISERNIRALARCAEKGIYVVPTTGRPTDGVPKRIRELPGVRYAITTNGGAIVDLETGEQLMSCTLSPEKAVELLEITREFDVMADPYIGGRAVTEERCMARLHHYGLSEAMQTMVHDTRDVVSDVVEYVSQVGKGVEKINIFFADIADRAPLRCRLERESGIAITAAMVNNLELNDENATKGNGLMWFLGCLGFCGALLAFVLSFVPPSQISTGSNTVWFSVLIIGCVVVVGAPFVIYALRKPSWKDPQAAAEFAPFHWETQPVATAPVHTNTPERTAKPSETELHNK